MPFQDKSSIAEKAPLLRLLLPFTTGIICYECFRHYLPGPFMSLVMAGICLYLLWRIRDQPLNRRNRRAGYFILLQILIILTGVLTCCLRQDRNPGNAIKAPVMARVYAPPVLKNKSVQYKIQLLARRHKASWIPASGKALVYTPKTVVPAFHLGDTILLPHSGEPIQNAGNPYEFNYSAFCRRNGIHTRLFLEENKIALYGRTNRSMTERIHQYCADVLERNIADSTTQALMKAMLLGDEQEIDPVMRQTYSDTGIIHIVSISGAHVAMLFFFISFCFRGIKNPRLQWIRFTAGIGLVWLYVVLTGAPAPAVRAAIMFSIFALGQAVHRQSGGLNQLCAAALVMLLYEPMWLFQVGFQLSFIAVLSLLLFYRPIAALWPQQHKWVSIFTNSISASLAAEILVAPLVIYYFHNFPIMFLPANLIATCCMGILLCLGFLLLLCSALPSLAHGLSLLLTSGSQVFHYCIERIQQLSLPTLKVIFITLPCLFLLYLFISALSFYLVTKKKPAVWFALMALLLCSFLVFRRNRQICRQEKVIVYHTPKEALIEYLHGRTYTLLTHNPTAENIRHTAHIGYGTHQELWHKSAYLLLNHKKYC